MQKVGLKDGTLYLEFILFIYCVLNNDLILANLRQSWNLSNIIRKYSRYFLLDIQNCFYSIYLWSSHIYFTLLESAMFSHDYEFAEFLYHSLYCHIFPFSILSSYSLLLYHASFYYFLSCSLLWCSRFLLFLVFRNWLPWWQPQVLTGQMEPKTIVTRERPWSRNQAGPGSGKVMRKISTLNLREELRHHKDTVGNHCRWDSRWELCF